MKRLLYLLVLVAAVSLTAYISASGEVYHDGGLWSMGHKTY